MADGEIIDPQDYSTREVIQNGELVGQSEYKDVYRLEDQVVKIYFNEDPEAMQRLGTYLPQELMPETIAREEDLTDLEGYHGKYTVIHQESCDHIEQSEEETDEESKEDPVPDTLERRLKNSEENEELGELIYILDRTVEENAAMTDPVIENFQYFNGKLKPSDICDIESVKSFPESFELRGAEESYHDEIENMYEDAIASTPHYTSLGMAEAAQIFKETSAHIEDIEIAEEGLVELPKVTVKRTINRF